jgi:hypothetical protein
MARNALRFVETAAIGDFAFPAATREAIGSTPLNLDKLPQGVVAGNTLIDYSQSPVEVRGGLSLAMTFASRATTAAMPADADEDDWFALYKSNLMQLGFSVSQSAFTTSKFRKRGMAVHQAIIPFLTIALGGAAVGPVMLALLENLKTASQNQPWITLFDQESRRYETREMCFAAVSSSAAESNMRHVAARLSFVDKSTNVLFFKITDASAEFESATTTVTANNQLLTVIEQPLRERLKDLALKYIVEARL